MQLNAAGEMIKSIWLELPKRFPNMNLDEFIIMPNHLHAVFFLIGTGAPGNVSCPYTHEHPNGTLPGTIGRILQAFKSITTDEYINGVKQWGWKPFKRKLWQRNYWGHIIRDEEDYNHICEYIYENPAHWQRDPLNT